MAKRRVTQAETGRGRRYSGVDFMWVDTTFHLSETLIRFTGNVVVPGRWEFSTLQTTFAVLTLATDDGDDVAASCSDLLAGAVGEELNDMSADGTDGSMHGAGPDTFGEYSSGISVPPEALRYIDCVEGLEQARIPGIFGSAPKRLLHDGDRLDRVARILDALNELAGTYDRGPAGRGGHLSSSLSIAEQ
jgi:hypothetical protein